MKPQNGGKRISTTIFIGLVIAAAMVMSVVGYSFWLMSKRDMYPGGSRPSAFSKTGRGPKRPVIPRGSPADAFAPTIDDDADGESEISVEQLIEFSSAIKSMKSTLKNLRSPMSQKKVDPLLAAHPNHRLTFHDLHKTDRAHSIFVSLTSYYSKHCKSTVRSLFDSATDDHTRMRIFVGAVQVATPVPPHTTTFEPLKNVPAPPLAVEPLPEHTGDSCLGDPVLTDCPEKFFCYSDNVKIRDLKKEEWRGHGHARWLSIAMYRSESYVMFLDSRANVVSHNWHSVLETEWLALALAAGSTRVVLSQRVGVHVEKQHQEGAAGAAGAMNVTAPEGDVTERMPLCAVTAAASPSALPGTLEPVSEKFAATSFVSTPFASAGFLYGPGLLLLETVFDSQPWTSENARDWHLSAALYSVGYDVYAPRATVVAMDQTVADAKKTSEDMLAEAAQASTGVADGDKFVAAILDGRQSLPVHPANSRKQHRKLPKPQQPSTTSHCKELHV